MACFLGFHSGETFILFTKNNKYEKNVMGAVWSWDRYVAYFLRR